MVLHVLVAKAIRSKSEKKGERDKNSHSGSSTTLFLDSSVKVDGDDSTRDIVEKLLFSQNSSYALNSSVGHTRSTSSAHGHGSSIHGHMKHSSRASSVINFGQHSGPKDITDLDDIFNDWDLDSSYDDEEYVCNDRISGAFDEYYLEEDKDGENHCEDILPQHNLYKDQESSQQIKQRAPVIINWEIRQKRSLTAQGGQLAQPVQQSDDEMIKEDRKRGFILQLPVVLSLTIHRVDNFFFVSQSSAFSSTGQRRIDYLDGMRGMACLLVSLGHFFLIFYIGVPNQGAPLHYPTFETHYRYILGAITNNATVLLGTFFALPARTACQRYLLR